MPAADSDTCALVNDAKLRVRINQIDYTLVQPGSLDNSSLPRVPVIRIYGVSSVGKKACVHVHQVFPYFFIEYPGKLDAKHGTFRCSFYNSAA